MIKKQEGKYDFDFTPFLWFCVFIVVLAGWILFVGVPWLWNILKPFLHQITG